MLVEALKPLGASGATSVGAGVRVVNAGATGASRAIGEGVGAGTVGVADAGR